MSTTNPDNNLTHYEPIPDESIVIKKNENTGLLGNLAKAEKFRQLFPTWAKRLLRRFLPRDDYSRQLSLADPFYHSRETPLYKSKYDVTFGILKDSCLQHKYAMAACLDLKVDYRLIDIFSNNWYENVKNSGCDLFLVHPTVDVRVRKQMFEDRLKVISDSLGKEFFPRLDTLWLYESKHRMKYWLEANGFDHPGTWIFFKLEQAMDFCNKTDLPIVYKTDMGAGASGVRIINDRKKLQKFVKNCFRKGLVRHDCDPRDAEWGCVLLQEYIPQAREWRMIRIGDSYFGYEKIKVGDFHSGSHSWAYSRPDDKLLNLLKDVTDKGSYKSMDLDVFVSKDGRMLINEMQAVFGMGNPYEMCVVNEKPGRMLYNEDTKVWYFDEGLFCQNHMWNLRVQYLLEKLCVIT